MGHREYNQLWGHLLAVNVVEAIASGEIAAPVTNRRIANYLVKRHAPELSWKDQERLFLRIQELTAKLTNDGKVKCEAKEGTRRFKYNTYSIPTRSHV